MEEKFKQVATDFINKTSELQYEDRELELIRLQIQYVLIKMLDSEKEFKEDIKTLDMKRK